MLMSLGRNRSAFVEFHLIHDRGNETISAPDTTNAIAQSVSFLRRQGLLEGNLYQDGKFLGSVELIVEWRFRDQG